MTVFPGLPDPANPCKSTPQCESGYLSIDADTVAPCRSCLPDVWKRWIDGHLAGDHDPDSCQSCRDAKRGRRQRASYA